MSTKRRSNRFREQERLQAFLDTKDSLALEDSLLDDEDSDLKVGGREFSRQSFDDDDDSDDDGPRTVFFLWKYLFP